MSSTNKEKSDAIKSINEFIESEEKLFILKGKAGTGKTTIITKIFSNPIYSEKKIVMSAPTNKAVAVLQNMLRDTFENIEFRTIHKLCKIKRKINNDGVQSFNLNECPKSQRNSIYSYDIIIIDESSMISMEIFILLVNLSKKIKGKIIFVGDDSQLPPINEPFSKIFDPSFNYNIKSLTLNNIERYKNNILKFSLRLIESLNNDKPISIKGLKSPEFIISKDDKEWLKEYVKNIDLDNIVLAYTNRRCDEINYYVRKKYFPDSKDEYIKNEIIVFNNFYNSPVNNTKFYTSYKCRILDLNKEKYIIQPFNKDYILDLKQDTIIEHKIKKYTENTENTEILCPICYENKVDDVLETECKHKFCEKCIRQWLVKNNCCPFCRMDLSDGKIVFSEDKKLTMLLEKFMEFVNNLEYNIWKIKISSENSYIYVINRNNSNKFKNDMELINKSIIEIKNHILAVKKRLKIDNSFLITRLWEYYYYNIKDIFADISYGYCLTVHKSQGSTYNYAFIDTKNILDSPKKFRQHLKCLYTASTRASKKINILI